MATTRQAGPLRVLVVDDYPDAAESLSFLLTRWGYEPAGAYGAAEAVAAAVEGRPDVVLMDVGLAGGVDGYEAARRIRAQPGMGGATVFLALTGYGEEEDRRRSRAADFLGHLVKPFDPDELRRLLARCAAAAGAAPEVLAGHRG